MASFKNSLLSLSWLVLRYVAGFFLAGGSSLLVFSIGLATFQNPTFISTVSTLIAVAFVGIATGPFVVPRNSRILASSLYLILGILYSTYARQMMAYGRVESGAFTFLYPLLIGGVLGVCLHVILVIRWQMILRMESKHTKTGSCEK